MSSTVGDPSEVREYLIAKLRFLFEKLASASWGMYLRSGSSGVSPTGTPVNTILGDMVILGSLKLIALKNLSPSFPWGVRPKAANDPGIASDVRDSPPAPSMLASPLSTPPRRSPPH